MSRGRRPWSLVLGGREGGGEGKEKPIALSFFLRFRSLLKDIFERDLFCLLIHKKARKRLDKGKAGRKGAWATVLANEAR